PGSRAARGHIGARYAALGYGDAAAFGGSAGFVIGDSGFVKAKAGAGAEVGLVTIPQSRISNPESPPMDKVFIEGLEIEALIGIYDWERRIRQTLRFDLEMAFDNRVPAASDDIAHTLDYKA